MHTIQHHSRGQSILETLIALSVLLLGLSAIIIVAFQNQSGVVYTQLNSKATYLAKIMLEETRAAAENNFSAITSSSSTENIFLKEIVVQNISDNKKQVTSRVSWTTDPLRPQNVELVTIITNWKIVAGDDGTGPGSSPSGNWANPKTLGTTDLGPGNEGTDIDIKNLVIFMTAKASAAAKDDFFSIDVSNPNSPTKLASINTGAGLESISIRGNYAYVAGKGTSQLQVIDVSNPSNPTLVANKSMQGVSEDGKSVFALDEIVLIGSLQSSGNELQIFSISNPLNPTFINSIEIGSDVNDIYVDNGRAYVASSKTTGEISIYDISNPSSPQLLTTINDQGTEPGLTTFAKDPFTLFVGIGNDFVIYDITNPQSPNLLSRLNAGGVINDIFIIDYLAFIGTGDSNKEFQIINVETYNNPYVYSTLNFPQMGTGIVYRNNIAYMSVRSNDALRIITSQ